jgi:hypothetical protein
MFYGFECCELKGWPGNFEQEMLTNPLFYEQEELRFCLFKGWSFSSNELNKILLTDTHKLKHASVRPLRAMTFL